MILDASPVLWVAQTGGAAAQETKTSRRLVTHSPYGLAFFAQERHGWSS